MPNNMWSNFLQISKKAGKGKKAKLDKKPASKIWRALIHRKLIVKIMS